ncbi:MAG: SDR family NAD(P)-dependent oxidoreductase, partial [Polyangiales bacterium]
MVLAARSTEPLHRLVEELGADVAHAVPTDVPNLGACEHLLEEATSRFGSIDILVNNAGYNSRGPLEELPMDL